MVIAYSFPDQPRNAAIRMYITAVDETLQKVFNVSSKERHRILGSLRKESEGYWDVTLHDLPLYCAARLAGVQILYPKFDEFEDRYSIMIEGKNVEKVADQSGDD